MSNPTLNPISQDLSRDPVVFADAIAQWVAYYEARIPHLQSPAIAAIIGRIKGDPR